MTKIKIPELLAPAGSYDALKAAIAAGADAVYLGGKRFGARMYAGNFNEESLSLAVKYAHVREVSVYVTVNTLIKEDEIDEVSDYLVQLYSMGIDAVLVQDLGVAALARELVPDLELHASTQMTIHNQEGVLWAKKHGFRRVVLARELSIEEIEGLVPIAEEKGIGLEIFVHGALCYGYSGQCLLSSVIGGRSGNRGMCAQPCRKPYRLMSGSIDEYGRPLDLAQVRIKDGYLLSTRDLCTYPRLNEIVSARVDSLKIEGRMKSPDYVAVVVETYRKALDAIASGPWRPSHDDETDLALAFNRGFTAGYLLSNDVMGREMPDNRGVLVGHVEKQGGDMIAIRLEGDLEPEIGDGMLISSDYDELGFVVRQPPKQRDGLLWIAVPNRVKIGSKAMITSKSSFSDKVKRIISNGRPLIKIDTVLDWVDDFPKVVGTVYGKNGPLMVEFRSPDRMETALNRPLTTDVIESQLRRTGGTPFVINDLKINYPGGLYAPVGALNKLRRDFLSEVETAIVKSYIPNDSKIEVAKTRLMRRKRNAMDGNESNDAMIDPTAKAVVTDTELTDRSPLHQTPTTTKKPHCRNPANNSSAGSPSYQTPTTTRPPVWMNTVVGPKTSSFQRSKDMDSLGISVYVQTFEALKGAIDGGAETIYFEPLSNQDLKNTILKAVQICEDKTGIKKTCLVWKWPKIARQRELEILKRLADIYPQIMVENVGSMNAALETGSIVYGGPGLNVWNSLSIGQVSSLSRITLSQELSYQEMAAITAHVPRERCLEMVVQGNQEAMVTEDDLFRLGRTGTPLGRIGAPFLGLRDDRRTFPIWRDADKRTHIQNSVETCLIDHLPKIANIGINSIAIDARGKTQKYAFEMTRIYKEATILISKDYEYIANDEEDVANDLECLKVRIKAIALGGITTGPFLKGLKET